MGKQQKIWVITYPIDASVLINGTTIHFLLGSLIDKYITINEPNSIIDIWPNI